MTEKVTTRGLSLGEEYIVEVGDVVEKHGMEWEVIGFADGFAEDYFAILDNGEDEKQEPVWYIAETFENVGRVQKDLTQFAEAEA